MIEVCTTAFCAFGDAAHDDTAGRPDGHGSFTFAATAAIEARRLIRRASGGASRDENRLVMIRKVPTRCRRDRPTGSLNKRQLIQINRSIPDSPKGLKTSPNLPEPRMPIAARSQISARALL